MYRKSAALIASLFILVCVNGNAQNRASQSPMMSSVDPAFFQGLRYRLVGPSRGGRVTTVTGVPSQPKTFYMGVASGGVFRTIDGGASWTPITDGKVPLGSIGSIAVADSDPNMIYLGTGSDGVRSNVSTGRGVYKTTDGGQTWNFLGLYNAGQIGSVRIHPTNPNIVWVAAVGDIFKPNSERGVFKTTDGGKTWRKVLFVSDQVGAMDVELQPGNPNVVYAWMSRLERKPWTIISGSREGGFYKSTDGGEHFTKITTGLPNELIGKANLAVTAAKTNRIYALIEAKPGGGLYRSDDAGQTWTAMKPQPANIGAQMIQRPFYYTTLAADPTNADVVYAGAEGFFKSTDGGDTWENRSRGLAITMFYDLDVAPNDGAHYGGGAQDNGTVVTRTGDPKVFDRIYPGDGGWLVYDPENEKHLYCSCYNLDIRRYRGTRYKNVSPRAKKSEQEAIWMCYITLDPSKWFFGGSLLLIAVVALYALAIYLAAGS